MAGSGFLLPMVAGVALSCVSYGFVARIFSKRQISTLRAVSCGILGTLSLVLGVCAFSAVSAEHLAAKHKTLCLGSAGMLCKSAPQPRQRVQAGNGQESSVSPCVAGK